MITIIIINGLASSGKSTFISFCKDYYEKTVTATLVYELSSVDKVKDIARYCGWDGTKTAENRQFLSDLKGVLAKWNNLPINSIFTSINTAVQNHPYFDHVFFVNSREPEDIEKIENMAKENNYDVKKICIVNPNIKSNEVPELIAGIQSIKYDKTIINDGNLGEFYDKAKEFCQDIVRG